MTFVQATTVSRRRRPQYAPEALSSHDDVYLLVVQIREDMDVLFSSFIHSVWCQRATEALRIAVTMSRTKLPRSPKPRTMRYLSLARMMAWVVRTTDSIGAHGCSSVLMIDPEALSRKFIKVLLLSTDSAVVFLQAVCLDQLSLCSFRISSMA